MRKAFYSSCGLALVILAGAAPFYSQTSNPKKQEPAPAVSAEITSSPAYAELLLRKTDLRSELESLALEYTEEYPRIRELRYVLSLLDRDMARIAKIRSGEGMRLTLALGKLMLRKIELETDLWKLQASYQEGHPDVKRAKRKVEIYENAVAEILK